MTATTVPAPFSRQAGWTAGEGLTTQTGQRLFTRLQWRSKASVAQAS